MDSSSNASMRGSQRLLALSQHLNHYKALLSLKILRSSTLKKVVKRLFHKCVVPDDLLPLILYQWKFFRKNSDSQNNLIA
ncbi:hypothetical protein VNO80_18878 [Phaseolus coccineus]|uniref:Uncharacterized protein n=1 Tax=Phaseolus coccineus TaxID=3886 RepID=A0AAN9MF55_PHACN